MGFSLKTVLLRLVQGFIIGAGGILPGISGGVLSVIFGIYRPVMEVLAHPLNGLRRHLSLLLPVGAGAILGFLCGGGLILVLFDRSEKLATCLFIGLILGTLPSLWAEAGAQGRGRGAYLSCAASFLALSAVLLYAQYGAFYTMRPGFLGFLFCGLLWGLSLIVPGMTSSSILMAVGLFTPMAEGFARLDMAVILPWLLGMALIVLTLARVVNWCSGRTTRFSTTPCSASCWPRRSLSSPCATTARATRFCACLPPRSARSQPISARSYSRRRMHKNIKSRQEPYGSCRLPYYPLFLLRYSRAKRRSSSS